MRRDQQGRGPVSEGVTQGRDLVGEGPRDHRSWVPWWGGPGGLCTREEVWRSLPLSCDVEVWLRKTAGCQVLDALGGCVLRGLAPGPKPGVSQDAPHRGTWGRAEAGAPVPPPASALCSCPMRLWAQVRSLLASPHRALRPPAWEHQMSCGGPRSGSARGWAGSPRAWLAAGSGAAHGCLGQGSWGSPGQQGLVPGVQVTGALWGDLASPWDGSSEDRHCCWPSTEAAGQGGSWASSGSSV